MANSTEQLIEALGQKEIALAELVGILEEEQRSLLELDLASLDLQVTRKAEALAGLRQRAARCRSLMAQLSQELGIPEAKTLSALLPALPSPDREELCGLQERLLELGESGKRQEAANDSLLKGALLTVNRSLEFFGRLFSRSATYGEGGRLMGGACSPKLLRREA